MRRSLFTHQNDNEGAPLGKGLCTILGFALCLSNTQLAAQLCPTIVNCAQIPPTYCDEGSNDLSLWNDPPFTISPTIGDSNLHEAAIDLTIKSKGCTGGGLTSISFLLFLDLDNDDLQETVLKSNALPPGGRVMANNSFNPGYSGGDTVWFDQRALPDSMLYRFALEIVYSGDTTMGRIRFCSDAAPYDYAPVILPEGRHRVEWRVVQDGIERFCDRNFRVKDCKKPTVTCKAGIAVYLDVSQTASLSLAQALQSVSDNITPDTQLVVGMRRVGAGFGFPLDAMGHPQDTVMYNCQNDLDHFIEIWAVDKAGNLENCTAKVLVYDTAGFCPFVPFPSICARTYWNEEIVRGVAFSTIWTIPNQPPIVNQLTVDPSGCSELSALPPTSLFSLIAAKDTFPLNGVTTYDLLLISKHILALQPFDAGWKNTAADVNQSNSVTTFDIVELRKLILGLTNKLPNATPSWLFFVDTCTVWGNPFYGYCPKAYSLPVQSISSYPPNLSFNGIKMGDVNASASSIDTFQGIAVTRGAAASLELPDITLRMGETLDIPLRATEGGAWEGLQFSLKFDPEILEIEGVVPNGSIALDLENWSKPDAGVLNLSWSNAIPTPVLPGDALLHLRVKARSTARLSEVFKMPKVARVQPEVYDAAGVTHPLQLVFSQRASTFETGAIQVFTPMPNPTTGSALLPLRLNAAETVSLEICDLRGQALWRMVSPLEPGAHFLEIPAAAMSQSGVYVWRVCAGNVVQSGRMVRL
ncbi:MAG: hypothetical protein H7246_16265 [Phycisphaerae bacterium]|nr:hypothetical protein [Saprospiraceae bacterium]